MNTQKPCRPDYGTMYARREVDVYEVFTTIQGEGPFAGRAAIFVRMYGCNLNCPACDTDYTSKRSTLSNEKLHDLVLAESNKTGVKLVVVTGGEPLRQDIEDFLLLCVSTGLTVQIETNGTLHPGYLTNSLLDSVVIVVSPKGKVLPTILERANALKYVISAGAVDEHFFPIRVLGNLQRPSLPPPGFSTTKKVYIQPEDSLDPVVNKENLQVAVASCMRNGYTLCVQLHKIIGLK